MSQRSGDLAVLAVMDFVAEDVGSDLTRSAVRGWPSGDARVTPQSEANVGAMSAGVIASKYSPG